VQEHIKVALNLLGCRPVNLTVLLLTLKIGDLLRVGAPAQIVAGFVGVVTESLLPDICGAHALFKFPLNAITLDVLGEEQPICIPAFIVEHNPLCIGRLVCLGGGLQPCSITMLGIRLAFSKVKVVQFVIILARPMLVIICQVIMCHIIVMRIVKVNLPAVLIKDALIGSETTSYPLVDTFPFSNSTLLILTVQHAMARKEIAKILS